MNRFSRILSCFVAAAIMFGLFSFGHNNASAATEYHYLSGTRDPFYQPFSSTSIWNMPIGSGAEYKAANLPSTRIDANGTERLRQVSIDTEYILKTGTYDEVLTLYSYNSTWDDSRWPSPDLLGKSRGTLYWPGGYTVAKTTGNACSAVLQPDRRTIIQLQPTCRADSESTYITGYQRSGVDIYGSGEYGSHFGSGLSTIGGSIRVGELTSGEPIRHALKLNINAKEFLYYGEDVPGYKWPADRADSYASKTDAEGNKRYGGTDPQLVMGSLLALPKDITAADLGITSEVGKKLFFTLQNYGCYITDDSNWNAYCICAEVGVREEVIQKYGEPYDMKGYENAYAKEFVSMVSSLAIVVNNSADSIGGGGTPMQPLLPEIYPVQSVEFGANDVFINVGDSVKLNTSVYPLNASYQKVSYKSNNEGVATVLSDGTVTAKKVGTATITVTTEEGGHTDICTITVIPTAINTAGSLTSNHLNTATQCVLGRYNLTDSEKTTIDMDLSGTVDSLDALIIKQRLLGII